MTLAIKWGDTGSEDSGLVYFDSVQVFTQNYSGQVTKHPIDAGASIVDHYVKQNPVFTLSGVITGVDVSTGSYLIKDTEGNSPVNARQAPSAVSVNSTDSSILSKFIPASIGQFLPDTQPDIVMDDIREDLVDQIRDALIDLTSGERFNDETSLFESNIQLVKLFEYKNTVLNRVLNNLVITNVKFNENVETGDALYCDITFEQVKFASLKVEELPKSLRKSLGKVDSTPKDTDDPDNEDAENKKQQIEDSRPEADPIRVTGDDPPPEDDV